MRLIDADKLDWWYKGRPIRRVIDEAPTIDAVPVVRCKDCKFSTEDGGYDSYEQMLTHLNCHKIRTGYLGCTIVPKDGFCFYGERKDND